MPVDAALCKFIILASKLIIITNVLRLRIVLIDFYTNIRTSHFQSFVIISIFHPSMKSFSFALLH